MKKRGTLEYTAIIIIILTTIGALFVISESKHIYVGNTKTKEVYDYNLCPKNVESIPKQNQILFENLNEAKNQNYKEVEGCI